MQRNTSTSLPVSFVIRWKKKKKDTLGNRLRREMDRSEYHCKYVHTCTYVVTFRYVVLLWQDVQVRFWLQNNSLKSVWSNTVFDHGLDLVVIIIIIYICSYVYVIWTKVKIYATILYSRNFVEANTQQEKSVHDMIWWLDKTNLICFVLVKKHLFINFPSPRLAIHPVHNIELTVKLTGCRSLQSL